MAGRTAVTPMCDTLVALGSATADGALVFGKNSDRPAGEAQLPCFVEGGRHPAGARVECTYIAIPQARETHGALLSRPTWMWGAEMGVNAYGVVIGNEAVWTRAPLGPPALLGMDLVRLGLERATAARQAVEVITSLLERHGQGGACADGDPGLQYHNSFLIADAGEAWVLETADRDWAAQRVADGIGSISNRLSIRRDAALASRGARARMHGAGDFAAAFGLDTGPDAREARGRKLLADACGRITPDAMKVILRDHVGGICMHGGFRTTASMVCHVRAGAVPRVWMTWGDTPCATSYREVPIGTPEQASIGALA